MFQLESSLEGMNIVNVLPRRGNALIVFRPLLAPRTLVSQTETALRPMAEANLNLGREKSPEPTGSPIGQRLFVLRGVQRGGGKVFTSLAITRTFPA
jgi:hypothetical protein